MNKKITFLDVARDAGVSPATVSRVATGAARVAPEVKKRVKDSASKLGIDLARPNKSRVLAFLLGNRDRLHPFHSRVLVGAEDFCAQHGYNLIFFPFRYSLTSSWRELQPPRFSGRRQSVDGFILGGTNSSSLIELLEHKRFPFAVLGNNVVGEWNPENYDVVWSDDTLGSYEITRYLQSLGHRIIGYVQNSRLPWFSRCHEGYRRAMLESSLSPLAADFNSESTQEVGYMATKSMFRRGDQVSAILAGDPGAATGAYRAVKDFGLRIPEDVSVAGIGESGAEEILDPPLTTTREFPDQVGSELARLVIERINQLGLAARQVVVPTQLVRRQSCSRIPTGGAPEINQEKASNSIQRHTARRMKQLAGKG